VSTTYATVRGLRSRRVENRWTIRPSTASRPGCRTCSGTSPTRRPSSSWRAPLSGKHTPVFYLEIPPFLFGAVVKGLAGVGLTNGARVVVEKPFGHDPVGALRDVVVNHLMQVVAGAGDRAAGGPGPGWRDPWVAS
jgi:hypothetical protein